jgi:ATP-dependent Clp protease ATP-binding subunit ClpA
MRARKQAVEPAGSTLMETLSQKIIGQEAALEAIVPYVRMFQAGLSPEGRPVGVFLLLGPTGTGKTRTVEALAEALHGSERNLVRIDCGEFQMEHEVAKLIGAPPGYLGHRETQPLLTQVKLSTSTSERSNLSIVLFDEVEKAAPSLHRLLLGVLDKAQLRLGDNNSVNFENSLIFLTSNLGARGIAQHFRPEFGFEGFLADRLRCGAGKKLHSITMAAVRKKFSPEFVNRIDVVLTYSPLSQESLRRILDHQIMLFERHIGSRLGPRAFQVEVAGDARRFLLERGTSPEYGARELKRILHRFLIQPVASMVADGEVEPASRLLVELDTCASKLRFREPSVEQALPARKRVVPIGGDQQET